MLRRLAFAIAISSVVSSSSFADIPEPVQVHSSKWSSSPQYTGPMETCDQMTALPHWGTADGTAQRYPSKQNLELAAWCKNADDQLLKVCQQEDGWAPTLVNSDCVFLVGRDGKIQDPFVFPGGTEKTDNFALKALFKLTYLPPAPLYLLNRRLKLYFAYPKVFIQIDFNEGEDPDRAKYLESMKQGCKQSKFWE